MLDLRLRECAQSIGVLLVVCGGGGGRESGDYVPNKGGNPAVWDLCLRLLASFAGTNLAGADSTAFSGLRTARQLRDLSLDLQRSSQAVLHWIVSTPLAQAVIELATRIDSFLNLFF